MKHKVKLTVIDKKCYPELQEKFCADPKSGPCPCYNVGEGPRHLHRIPRLSEAPWEVP